MIQLQELSLKDCKTFLKESKITLQMRYYYLGDRKFIFILHRGYIISKTNITKKNILYSGEYKTTDDNRSKAIVEIVNNYIKTELVNQ